MSDKKETAASLGHSEELRIEYAPRQTVPELVHFGQELSESLPAFARERTWDVFPKKPLRTYLAYCSNVFVHESRLTLKPLSLACDAE